MPGIEARASRLAGEGRSNDCAWRPSCTQGSSSTARIVESRHRSQRRSCRRTTPKHPPRRWRPPPVPVHSHHGGGRGDRELGVVHVGDPPRQPRGRRCGVAGSWSSTASRTRSGRTRTRHPIHDRTMRVASRSVLIGPPPRRGTARRRRVPRAARASRDEVEIGPSRPGRRALGDLVERQVQVVVQDHHRPMIDGQPPEAALELVAIDDLVEGRPSAIGSSAGSRRRFGVQLRARLPSA